jgi:DNA-binding response OmpR family regulator
MKKRILYVEDEPFLSKIVKESLETRQFEVHLIEDGNLAFEAFLDIRPDICVLDIMLPGTDGYTIGKNIRAADPRVPIIFLTAKQQTEDVVQGFESGGNDYVRKPFSLEELIVRINNLLQMAPNRDTAAVATTFSMGRFVFDPVRQTLSLDGHLRQLSFREAQLLHIFAQRPNATIERREILETIWGSDSIFNSRNLDVYITRMREYLRDDAAVQIITLKGVGYRLVIA